MIKFNVTFERWTPSDIEAGDTDKRGFLAEGVTLREALEYISGEPSSRCELQHIGPSDSRPDSTQWLTWDFSPDYETGESISLSLHFPRNTSPSSRGRLVKLFCN